MQKMLILFNYLHPHKETRKRQEINICQTKEYSLKEIKLLNSATLKRNMEKTNNSKIIHNEEEKTNEIE